MLSDLLRPLVPLLLLIAACGAYRVALPRPAGDAAQRLAKPDAAFDRPPTKISPRYNDPRVATDGQLHAVLARMKPTLTPVDTNVLVHALRLWGPRAEFGDSRYPSGPTMLGYFLDDAEFRRIAGANTPPLFMRDKSGVRVRPWIENSPYRLTGAVHTDDLLATLAESGVTLATPLITRDGAVSVADLMRETLARFHRSQYEYEWTAISYARYLFPLSHWDNRFGQPIDTDALADELLAQPMPNGVCGGAHRLEALVVLLRADDQYHALSRRTRRKITDYLTRMSGLLIASQNSAGYWNRNWYLGSAAEAANKTHNRQDGTYDRILTTGHHLEWLALAPPEVQPPRETIVRAAQWVVRAMIAEDANGLAMHYGPFSHAARALCLWRSKDPFEAWQAGETQPIHH
ncbi:MAG: hypothetical protein K8T25_21070 [Planctomycetia bacterium]|nr:hypothetical protein [Planctomycetia bacterium]